MNIYTTVFLFVLITQLTIIFFAQISLIYMDDKFNIYQKNLPNMVVKSCDCA